MIIATHGILAKSGSSFDSDAQAFITNASITDTTQKSAINQLVLDLKSASLWTKMKAIYPFVGGTAPQHRFNLKSAGTTDADFYLDFFGGWSHTSNGIVPNATNTYANTKLVIRNSIPSANFNHMSYDSVTNVNSPSEYTMGVYDGTRFAGMVISRDSGAQAYYSDVAGTTYYGAGNNSSTLANAFCIGTQQGTSIKFYKNSSVVASNTNLALGNDTPTTYPVFIGTYNSSGSPASSYTNKTCGFASIGDGLSDAEVLLFNTAVQSFQTTLGR